MKDICWQAAQQPLGDAEKGLRPPERLRGAFVRYGGRARNSIYRDFPLSSSNSSIVLGIVIDCKSFIIFTIFISKDSICRVCGYILFSLQPGNFKFPVLQTVLFETAAIAAQKRTSMHGDLGVGTVSSATEIGALCRPAAISVRAGNDR